MSQCAWIRSLCLWMLPVLVLSVGVISFGAIGSAGDASTIVALKRDSGLTAGGAIDERFDDATVRTVNVADAAIYIYGESRWMNGGASGGAGDYALYKFDLSSIPVGSTINLAQLRLYHTVGNGGAGEGDVSMVLTHAWSEGTGSYTYPGATAGVSYAHPGGTNTGPYQDATGGGTTPLQTWGPGSDSFFDIAVDAGSPIAPSSGPIGQGYHVLNVTSHVQQWVNGTYPNYGWAQSRGFWDFHLSEAGAELQPVLFIDYTSSGGEDTTAPAAVSNLATGSPTTSSITLTWTAPGDDGSTGTATSYDIRYATSAINDGNWASATQVSGEPAPALAGTSQSMVVSGLSASTTYYFAIKTSDEVPNTSAISNSPSGTTPAGDSTAPAAVSNLAVGTATTSSLTLTWTAPGDDGSTGTAASYDIRYSTSSITEANWAAATQVTGEPAPAAAGTSQSMVVSGLSSDTTYYFAIKTSDEVPNTSVISNSPSGTTDVAGPSAIVALKRNAGLAAGGAIDARFGSASVATTTVQDAVLYGVQQSRWYNGGSAGTSSGGSTGDSWVTYKYDLTPVPAYAKINLAQLRLKAAGGIGISSLAMIYTHDWIEGTTNWDYPGTAGGITYWAPIGYNTDFNQNPSGISSQPWGGWGPNSDSGLVMAVDGGPFLNPSSSSGGYIVYDVTAHVQTWVRGIRPNFGWVQLDYSRFSLSESGSNDQPVLFIDYALEGDTTPPATIANLATSNVMDNSVTLTWTAPGDDGSSPGMAAGYEVRYAKSPITAASWALATPVTGVPTPQTASTGQSMVVDNLLGNTTYYFAIKAADEVPNVTPLSNVVSVHTPADTVAPAAVSNLVAGSATNHSLTLTWTAPGDNESSGTANSYDIRYATSPITAGNWDAATPATGEPVPAAAGTSQSLLIDNLNQNTTYYFAIKTSDEVPNTSGLSNVASGQVLADTTAPGAVTSLAVTKTKSSALRLAWIASGDDGSTGTASSYDVRYSTSAINEGNWASATQVTGEPAAVQPGYHRNMWISGLSAGTTYYVGIKALDEVSNASTIATVSAVTPAASNLTRPLLQPSDLEFLGAFKLPQTACGMSTAYALSGLAVRRVNGNLQFLSGTHVYADGIYECNFPGWGSDQSTWPQATLLREWGMDVYGNPSVKQGGEWTHGLNYDQATGRLYYSYGHIYYVSQVNCPSLAYAVLEEGGPVVSGPWMSQNVHIQVMRGGSLTIPDWFADTYLDGRKLGVGFGGPWSGWSACSPGPTLAAAHHPDASQTDLDTIRLLQYEHEKDKWATRDGGYWWRTVQVYDAHLPDGDIGYWTPSDGVTGTWVDLPDKQGLLYITGKAYGAMWYDYGAQDADRFENWWRVYDPADLAEVAQGLKNYWEPQHDEWPLQGFANPPPGSHRPGATGIAFDAQSRTVFLIVPQSYTLGGQEWYPVVYGYRIKESRKIGDINRDGYVNVGDLQALVAAWGSMGGPPPSPNWNPDADLNGDNFVNVGDLQLLVAHWGE